jgi:acyl carrier protein
MNRPLSSVALIDALVHWLNARFGTRDVVIRRDTLLFDDGLINSIRILDIIAWIERAIDRPIPDRDIRMDNFASANRIVAVFATETSDVGA